MAQEEDKHSLEAKFAAAVKVIRSLPEEGDNFSVLVYELIRSDFSVQLCVLQYEVVLVGV